MKDIEALTANLAAVKAELKTIRTEVLSEKKTQNGYSVEVEFSGSTADLTQDLRTVATSNFRLVALLPETVDGARVTSPKVETALVGSLARQRFRVYDWNFVAKQRPLASLVSAILSDNYNAATQLGTRFLANVIVAGRVEAKFSQDNGGIISYLANANLRVIKVDTGQILTAKEFSEKGFGQDRAQAARKALDALAETVAKELPADLVTRFDEFPVTVQIALNKPEQAKEVEAFLRGLTGVTDVQRVQTPSGATFRVTSRDKPAALGAQIARSQDYQVVEYGRESH